MNNFEIGNVVSWNAGNIYIKGIVRDVIKDKLEVICVEIQGRHAKSDFCYR